MEAAFPQQSYPFPDAMSSPPSPQCWAHMTAPNSPAPLTYAAAAACVGHSPDPLQAHSLKTKLKYHPPELADLSLKPPFSQAEGAFLGQLKRVSWQYVIYWTKETGIAEITEHYSADDLGFSHIPQGLGEIKDLLSCLEKCSQTLLVLLLVQQNQLPHHPFLVEQLRGKTAQGWQWSFLLTHPML